MKESYIKSVKDIPVTKNAIVAPVRDEIYEVLKEVRKELETKRVKEKTIKREKEAILINETKFYFIRKFLSAINGLSKDSYVKSVKNIPESSNDIIIYTNSLSLSDAKSSDDEFRRMWDAQHPPL